MRPERQPTRQRRGRAAASRRLPTELLVARSQATHRQAAAQRPRTRLHVRLVLVLLAVHAVPALVVGLVDVAPLPHPLQHLQAAARGGSQGGGGGGGGQRSEGCRAAMQQQLAAACQQACAAATSLPAAN